MKKRILRTIAAILLIPVSQIFAQTPVYTVGNVDETAVSENEINLKAGSAHIKITVYTPTIIRVRVDKKAFSKDQSFAVVKSPEKVKCLIDNLTNRITIGTDSLNVNINKTPFSVTFLTKDGKVISEDETGLTTSWAGESVTCYKKMQENERFIGLGEKTGNLDRTGNAYTNWNSDVYGYSTIEDPLYSSIPYYIGLHNGLAYGLFLDNSYQTEFNFGASNDRFSSFGAKGGELNYYFIGNSNVAEIIKSYTWLTGRMPLPPKWSLGYQQNRYSYYPDSEVLRIAHTLREKKIPADGITLDIHYMKDYQLFTWDDKRFPSPLKMTDDLKKLGFKTTVIVDPGIKVVEEEGAFKRGLRDNIFIKYPDGKPYTGKVWPGWCNFPDFTSEKGREWWEKEVKFFADNGVSGIWNDMNEISTWGQKMPDNVLFDYDGKKTNHLEAHNVYGMQMARASYEGAVKHTNERPFILTRAGFAGLQRYTAIWTGDNRADEDHMIAGVRLMNSLGLSGVPFTGMDIGGFTGGPPTISLYQKWISLGAFTPYFRNHTTHNTKSSEPWTYGEEALGVARDYISYRYSILPYIYSAFYEAANNGLPIMRSLAINYSNDQKIFNNQFQNQYLFGPSFLVAPFESTKDFGKVYFPAGSWYNLYSDELMAGETEKIVSLEATTLPVYVKAGSIIPAQRVIQHTGEFAGDTLMVHVYNGNSTNSFTYYEDDGSSFDYQKGNYYKRRIDFDPISKTIKLNKVDGKFATGFKKVKLIMHGFKTLETVKVGEKAVKVENEKYYAMPGKHNDPQAKGQRTHFSNVKTIVFGNESDALTLHW